MKKENFKDMEYIRQAEERDLLRISEIVVFNYRINFYPIFRDDEFYFSELNVADIMREYENETDSFYVYDDGVVKGFVQIDGEEIVRLFVEPVLQGKGIGAKLLEFAVSEKGCRYLWALEKNERAKSFYERYGFSVTDEKKLEEDTTEYLVKLVKDNRKHSGKISILRKSIVKCGTDAVVNAANEHLLQGGGVCGYIFQACGPELLREECDRIGHCDTGNAVITKGFALSKYVIHAVGPVWNGTDARRKLLYSAYANSLRLADEYGCRSIAFPLLSAGIFHFPYKVAWEEALNACMDYLKRTGSSLDITFAVIDDDILSYGQELLRKKENE